ncbi:MAG: hypothetical protein AAGD32_02350 [Planctomycetota bacterium]
MTQDISQRIGWRFGTAICFAVAVGLVAFSVWLAVEAVTKPTPIDAWTVRLAAMSSLALAHLLLAWGVTSRVYPVSPIDKSIALTSMLVGTLAGVGALALALA